MATSTWKLTSGSANWSTIADWTPTAPQGGDNVLIGSGSDSGNVVVIEDTSLAISSLTLAAKTGGSGNTTTLTLTPGATLTVNNGLSLGTNTKVDGTGTLVANGAISGSGTITADSGLLDLGGNGSLSGPVLSIGTAVPSTLELNLKGGVTSRAIAITSANQTLMIGPAGAVTLTQQETVYNGTVQMAGGVLNDSKGIVLGQLVSGGTLAGFGTVNANLSTSGLGNNLVRAAGGTLDLVGKVSGTVTLAIDASAPADLKIDRTATTNNAILINSSNQTLEIGPTGSLTVNTLENVTNGTIRLDGGQLTDSAGITLGSGIASGAIIGFGAISANLNVSGTGTGNMVTAVGGMLDLKGAVGSGIVLAIDASAPADLKIDNAATSNNPIAISSTNQKLEIGSVGNLTIAGVESITNGTVQLDGGRLIDSSGLVLGGGGQLTGRGTVGAVVTLAGGIITQTGGSLTLNGITGFGIVNGNPVVSGAITASGGVLDLKGAANGTLNIDTIAGSDLKIDGTVSAAPIVMNNLNQLLEIGPAGRLTISAVETVINSTIQLDGGTLNDSSGITIGSGGLMTGKGAVGAAVTLAGGVITQSGGVLSLSGIKGFGVVNGNPTVTRTIKASGGILDLTGSPTGTLAIDTVAGSDLKIDGQVSAGAFTINNANQLLEIGALASLTITAAETVTNGTVQFDGGTLIDASGVTFGKGGLLTGSGQAGAITLAGGTITPSGGTLKLSSITGFGTVNGSPDVSGAITASGGVLDLTGVPTGKLAIGTAAGSDLKIESTLSSGPIAINNANQKLEIGALASLTITAAETITNGTIQLDGSTLIDAAGVTIGSAALLTGSGTAGAITLAGGTIAQTGGALSLSSITGFGTVNGNLNVSGAITASGGVLDLTGTPTGTLLIDTLPGSDLKIDSKLSFGPITINNTNQTLEIGATAVVTITAAESITNGKIQLDGGTLVDAAGVTVGTGATLQGSGTAGAITLAGGTITQSGSALSLSSITGFGVVNGSPSVSGAITASGGLLDLTGAPIGALLIDTVAGSDLKIDGALSTSPITINNANQLLEIGAAGVLTITAAESITNGAIQLDGGSLADAAGVTIGTGATLKGSGTVGAITLAGGTVTQTGGALNLSSITGVGAVGGNPSVSGAITASGGVLDLTGAPTGTLAIDTASASDLKIDSTLSTGAIAISNANQTLEIGATGNLTITAAEAVTNGRIQLDGGALADAAGITVGSGALLTGSGTAGAITLAGGTITPSGGALSLSGITGFGVINGSPNVGGAITASGGLLDLAGNATATSTTYNIASAAGSVFELDGTAVLGTKFTFAGPSGILELKDVVVGVLQGFSGTIAGLAAGNAVNIQGQVTSATLAGSTISVLNGTTTVATLQLSAAPVAGTKATLSPDATLGGFDVSLVAPVGTTISTSVAGPIVLAPADNPLSITNTGTVTSTGTGAAGIVGPAGTSWTIGNAGVVKSVTGNGVDLSGIGMITNAGSITGVDGIVLRAGGNLSNGSTGYVAGAGSVGLGEGVGSGIYVKGGAGSITNSGTIFGPAYGIGMILGGSVVNHALVMGGEDGVIVQNAIGLIANYGNIIATVDDGASLFAGGTVINHVGAYITGPGTAGAGIFITQGAGSVANDGTVTGDGKFGILLTAGGEITNGVTGSISGLSGAVFFSNVAGTLDNSGSVTTAASAATAVDLEVGGIIMNHSSGVISGGAAYGGHGIFATGSISTITNSGSITGFHAVDMAAGGSLTNGVGASIAGGRQGIFGSNAPVMVTNSGSISGATDVGVYLQAGGSVTNDALGSISGSSFGVYINHVSGTVSNSGNISGNHAIGLAAGGSVTNLGGNISGAGSGIFAKGGAAMITNSGRIGATSGAGADIEAGGTLSNGVGASISGSSFGIFLIGGTGTVDNAGTISGSGYGISFGNDAGNRLIMHPGAVVSGGANGGGGTLELAGSGGSIGGIGSVTGFAHFQTLAVDTGADWTLVGGNSIANVVNNGTVDVAGSLDVSGAVDPSSSGIFTLELNAILEVAAATESGTPIDFLASSELIIDNASVFGTGVGSSSYTGPQLQKFDFSDMIDIKNVSATGAALNYDSTTGLLQISDGASQAASLDFQTSSLGAGTFSATGDGGSGMLLTHHT